MNLYLVNLEAKSLDMKIAFYKTDEGQIVKEHSTGEIEDIRRDITSMYNPLSHLDLINQLVVIDNSGMKYYSDELPEWVNKGTKLATFDARCIEIKSSCTFAR